MKTSQARGFAWEGSLTYLVSRISPLMARTIENKLCRNLRIECRHLGVLNYLEDHGGSVRLGPETRRKRGAPAPLSTLEIIQMFGELFWGPQLDQQQPDLQVPALLAVLEEEGLVRRVYHSKTSPCVELLLTIKGRAIRKQAMQLVQETETEFLARFSTIFPESLTRGLLELREELLV